MQNQKDILKQIIDGTILTEDKVIRQLPFVLFITVLAIVYIGNRYHAEKVVRDTVSIQKELKELRSESITIASRIMFLSKESEVLKMVREHGLNLHEPKRPHKKIVITKGD